MRGNKSVIIFFVRKVILIVVLILGGLFIYSRIAEVKETAETFRNAHMRYILLAVAVQGIWLLNVALSFWIIYRGMGMDIRFERMVMGVAAANFVNVVTSTGGMGGVALLASDAKTHGFASGRVTMAGVVYLIFDYVGFIVLLVMGLIVLARRNNLTTTEIAASAILLLLTLVFIFLVTLGMRSGTSLGNVLSWMAKRVNRILFPFIRRDYLVADNAQYFAHEGAEGLKLLRLHPKNVIFPAILGLSSKILLMTNLLLMFLAFDVPFSAGTIIGGFVIGYLFFIVSPTPAGIGVVEGAMTIGLRTLNVPIGASAVIALAYRGITFWLPLLVGMFAFRWLTAKRKEAEGTEI